MKIIAFWGNFLLKGPVHGKSALVQVTNDDSVLNTVIVPATFLMHFRMNEIHASLIEI